MKKIITDLRDYYDEWLSLSASTEIGYPIGSELLNELTLGIPKGKLVLYCAGVGQGKTSSSIPLFALPNIIKGNNVTVISNEQTKKDYTNMLLTTVLHTHIQGTDKIMRQDVLKHDFTSFQKKKAMEAVEWLKAQKGQITFATLYDYSVKEIKEIIEHQKSKWNCNIYLYDTLKIPEENSNGVPHDELNKYVSRLFDVARSQDVSIVASTQLNVTNMSNKVLTLSDIGTSKRIADCAEVALAFRELTDEEKLECKPIDKNGKEVSLSKDKHYVVYFVLKNRNGNTKQQVVAEFNQDFNILKDVGYVKIQ